MNNPCYDRKTHTDCPRRAVGCSANCPDWASYVEKRNHIYDERYKEKHTDDALFAIGPRRLKAFRIKASKKLHKINNN